MDNNFNEKINTLKAVGIFFVLFGHCGVGISIPAGNWFSFSTFHMALFAFASGYFYKDDAEKSLLKNISKKIKKLLIPYFIWNIIYGLLNTLFRITGFIKYGDALSWESLFVRPWIDGHQFHFNIASWFLLSLFIISVIVPFMGKICYVFRNAKEGIVFILCIIIGILSVYSAQHGYNYGFYLIAIRAGYLMFFYYLGFLYHKYFEIHLTSHAVIYFGVVFLGQYLLDNLGANSVNVLVVFGKFEGSIFEIFAYAILGIAFWLKISEIIAPIVSNTIIHKIGMCSFDIMMHQGFILFLINLGLYFVKDIFRITNFDVDAFQNTVWYCYLWNNDYRTSFFYCVLIVFIILCLDNLKKKIKIRQSSNIFSKL